MPRLVVVALCRATIATVAIALLSGCIDTPAASTPTSQTESPATVTATSKIRPAPSPTGRAHAITELADHVLPAPGAAVSDKDTDLSIAFREPMDPSSFGHGTIEIVEAKYSRDVAGLFSVTYRTDLRPFSSSLRAGSFVGGPAIGCRSSSTRRFAMPTGVLNDYYEWTFDVP